MILPWREERLKKERSVVAFQFMARRIVCSICAVILLAAGAGAGKIVLEALNEEEIMHSGRRTSRLVSKEEDPSSYWMGVGFNSVMAVGLSAGGMVLLWKAVKR